MLNTNSKNKHVGTQKNKCHIYGSLSSPWLCCGFPIDGKVLFRSLFPRGTLNLCVLTFKDTGFGGCCNDFHCPASPCLNSSKELHTFNFLSWRWSQMRKKTSGGGRGQRLIDISLLIPRSGEGVDQWPQVCRLHSNCISFPFRQPVSQRR